MILNFLKGLEKKKKYLNSSQDAINYMHFKNREIYLDMISSKQVEEINADLRLWNLEDSKKGIPFSQRKPIKIYINCHGIGDINDILAITDAIKLSQTPVFTFNIGCIMNINILIFLAGEKRYAYPSSLFILNFENLDEKDESINNFYLLLIKNLFLEKTSINENQLDKYLKTKSWLNAKQAVDNFICHEVLKEHFLR